MPLRELLGRSGVQNPDALAVEGALRASVKPRRLTSRQYATLRSFGGAPLLAKGSTKQ